MPLPSFRAQMGYVAQVSGRTEEAVKIYNQIMKQRPTDVALAAVVSNNIVTTNKVGTMSLRLSRDCCDCCYIMRVSASGPELVRFEEEDESGDGEWIAVEVVGRSAAEDRDQPVLAASAQ